MSNDKRHARLMIATNADLRGQAREWLDMFIPELPEVLNALDKAYPGGVVAFSRRIHK